MEPTSPTHMLSHSVSQQYASFWHTQVSTVLFEQPALHWTSQQVPGPEGVPPQEPQPNDSTSPAQSLSQVSVQQ
jgi:hypothetical protein